MRILVLWNSCLTFSADEEARWVETEAAGLRASEGVADVTVHRVESAALRHPRQWDWCLELWPAGESPNALVRREPCSAFLADLRLLGGRPTVLVLPEAP